MPGLGARSSSCLAITSAGTLALLPGCAAGPIALAREGRVPEAWAAVCNRETEDGKSREELLSREERAELREMIMRRTRGTLTARALSRDALHERVGETVFPRDMVLLVAHLDVSAHPGAGIDITPQLRLGSETRVRWWNRDVWALAGVEPPQPASIGSYNLGGALVDAVVAGLTLGAIDPQLRGQKDALPTVYPGSPGTGTPLQQDVLYQLIDDSGHCSSAHTARLGHPCDAFYVMASGTPVYPDVVPVPLDDVPAAAPAGDALLLRVEHKADRYLESSCSLGYTIVVPLPPGPDAASRINAVFARGPVELGAPREGGR